MKELNNLKNKSHTINERYKLQSPAEIVPEYIEDKLYAKEHPLMLGIPKADQLLDGELRGKVIAVCGLAGSMKSLLIQQTCSVNAKKYQAVGCISNMEMSNTALLDRLMDVAIPEFQSDDNLFRIRPSKHYKGELNRDNKIQIMQEIQMHLESYYGNNLKINGSSSMTVNDYDNILSANPELDLLMVDGMSMTGEEGDENTRYQKMSAGLKELAKKYKVCIAVICHLSKTSGGRPITPYTRDSRAWVRGSQKIIDDLDICICMSKVFDSFLEEERRDLMYMWLYDKRGTGDILDIILEFEPRNLSLTESLLEPNQFNEN